jgi:DNA transposition AAA+ family ATPase
MHRAFAQTANVKAFSAAVTKASKRGAPEAGFVLVTGEAGYGKTRTVRWWGEKQGALYLRAKAAMTPHWLLSDLCAELGVEAKGSTQQLFALALGKLMQAPDRPLIVDEVEHLLRDSKVIEQLRDITDLVECPTILVGMESAPHKLARLPQISSRVASTVTFGPATEACVRATCEALSEVPIGDDLVAEILRQSGGRMREILNAIALAEALGKRAGVKRVGLADVGGAGVTLTNERRLRVVRGAAAEPAPPPAAARA